ncbi:DNA repair protein XRCC3 [Exaiptasia diaphana]|nr:DNA repair protein XRCC3 [Exaiptasia diaphana]
MTMERLDLPQRIISALKKARLENIDKIVCTSASDIQRLTKLSISDVALLHQVAASSISRPPVQTALELYHSDNGTHVSTGCPVLDKALRGGIACQGITEITGKSASGKTQLCLQLCLSVQLPADRGGLGRGESITTN